MRKGGVEGRVVGMMIDGKYDGITEDTTKKCEDNITVSVLRRMHQTDPETAPHRCNRPCISRLRS